MTRLTKAQIAEKVKHQNAVSEKVELLHEAVDRFNDALELQKANVEQARAELNVAIQEAEAWREEIHSAQMEHFENKSERWQEGDAGQTYQGWMDTWESTWDEVDELEFVQLEIPGCDVADDIDALTEEPG